jgi:hypothetical protein
MKLFIYDEITGDGIITLQNDHFPSLAENIKAAYFEDEPRNPQGYDPETKEFIFDGSYTVDVKLQDAMSQLNAIQAKEIAESDLPDEELIGKYASLRPTWKPGLKVYAGMLYNYQGVLYKVLQGTGGSPYLTQAHQPPGAEGMLAVYAPIRPPSPDDGSDGDSPALEWMSGETGLGIGDKRIDPLDGNTYEAIQNPGANVWNPSTAPALWKISEA